jgi:hypothetical protein
MFRSVSNVKGTDLANVISEREGLVKVHVHVLQVRHWRYMKIRRHVKYDTSEK